MFSNSLGIHKVQTKEIISVVVFGYLILLSEVSYNFNSPFSHIVLVLIEKIHQTLKTVLITFPNTSMFYPRPDDHKIRTTDTPGFKPFTMLLRCSSKILHCTSFFQLSSPCFEMRSIAWSFMLDILLHSLYKNYKIFI